MCIQKIFENKITKMGKIREEEDVIIEDYFYNKYPIWPTSEKEIERLLRKHRKEDRNIFIQFMLWYLNITDKGSCSIVTYDENSPEE